MLQRSTLIPFLFCMTCIYGSAAPQNAPFLITGCGRSGTHYTAAVLQLAGYHVDHEKQTGLSGTVSWYALEERHRSRSYGVILHQIRDPLQTIASMQTATDYSWRFIYNSMPKIRPQEALISRCAQYWLFWNQKAERIATFSYPVERIVSHLEEINHLLNIRITPQHCHMVQKNLDKRPHAAITWKMLKEQLDPELFQELVHYADKWGYRTPKEPQNM